MHSYAEIGIVFVVIVLAGILCFLSFSKSRSFDYVRNITEPDEPILGYVSFTTTPERILNTWIQSNIERLLKVSPRSLRVVLHVPRISRKGVVYEIPAFLKNIEVHSNRFIINRACEDTGPITKILPALKLPAIKNHHYIIVIDDDTSYKPEMFTDFLKALREDDNVVYAMCDARITGYQGFAFKKELLMQLKDLSVPEACVIIDDDVLQYLITQKFQIPVHKISTGDGNRTCSFDTRLTYTRPEREWSHLSTIHNNPYKHAEMLNACIPQLKELIF